MGLYQGDKPLSSIGKSPAAYAKDAGYTGTDDNFYTALANMPDHLSNQENPHGTTASQVGADVAGAANEALNSAKAYTDQIVAGVIPGDGSKESPADSDSIFIYDNADSGKPKKTLISKLVELFNNTFYTKTETDTTLQKKADGGYGFNGDLNLIIHWDDTDGTKFESSVDEYLLGMGRDISRRFKIVDYPACVVDGNGGYADIYSCCDLGTNSDCLIVHHAVWDGKQTILAFKQKSAGIWYPWEYVNPPMLLGVEYRTTERYQGKPVYCMTKFVGEVTANTLTQVILNESDIGEYCIRAFCTGKRTFGNWEDYTTAMISSPAGSETIITCDPTIYRINEGYRSIRAYIKSNVNLKDVYCTAYYTKWAD